MAAFSDYLENALLDHVLVTNAGAYTQPSAIYCSLYTTDPTDADSGAEVSGGSYARTLVGFANAGSGMTANDGAPLNGDSNAVTFPTATASWGTVAYFGLHDSSSGPNLLYHGALTTTKNVDNGDVFTFPLGNLTVEHQ